MWCYVNKTHGSTAGELGTEFDVEISQITK